MIEEVIDSFRNGLVRWLVALLLRLGANRCTGALTRANSRFKCPVCRLIETMRSNNLMLSRCWADFCSGFRSWSYRIFGGSLNGILVLSMVQVFQSQLAFLLFQRIWLPYETPIYLQKMVLRN